MDFLQGVGPINTATCPRRISGECQKEYKICRFQAVQ